MMIRGERYDFVIPGFMGILSFCNYYLKGRFLVVRRGGLIFAYWIIEFLGFSSMTLLRSIYCTSKSGVGGTAVRGSAR